MILFTLIHVQVYFYNGYLLYYYNNYYSFHPNRMSQARWCSSQEEAEVLVA